MMLPLVHAQVAADYAWVQPTNSLAVGGAGVFGESCVVASGTGTANFIYCMGGLSTNPSSSYDTVVQYAQIYPNGDISPWIQSANSLSVGETRPSCVTGENYAAINGASTVIATGNYLYCIGDFAGSGFSVQYAQILPDNDVSAWTSAFPGTFSAYSENTVGCVLIPIPYTPSETQSNPVNPQFATIYCISSDVLYSMAVLGCSAYSQQSYGITCNLNNIIEYDGTVGIWNPNYLPRTALTCASASLVTANNYLYCQNQYAQIETSAEVGIATTPWSSGPSPDNTNQFGSTSAGIFGWTTGFSCVTSAGALYCMGGQYYEYSFRAGPSNPLLSNPFVSAQILPNGAVSTWTQSVNSLAVGEMYPSCVTSNGYIYCVGGGTTCTGDYCYDTSGGNYNNDFTPSTAVQIEGPPVLFSPCPPPVPTPSTQATTSYTKWSTQVGGGTISQSSSGLPSNTPVIGTVLQNNANNAQWLISCPVAPDTKNTIQYFTTLPGSPFMGNRCLANDAPLTTNAIFTVSVTCGASNVASGTPYLAFQNIAAGNVFNLAYSGTTSYQNTGINDISNGYDSESYIFGQVPYSTENGLWTWSAKYADLSQFGAGNLAQLNLPIQTYFFKYDQQYTCQYRNPNPSVGGMLTTTYTCEYPYVYTVSSSVTSLSPMTINVPTLEGPATNFALINGASYGSFTEDDSMSSHIGVDVDWICAEAIQDGQGVGTWCAGTDFASATKVSGVTLYLPGQSPKNNLYAYLITDNGQQRYYIIYSINNYYGIVDGFSGGWVPASGTTLQYATLGAIPYLLYNLSMPATYSMINSHEQFLNLSFDLYSEHNYMDPTDYLGQLPLYTNSSFFATEGSSTPELNVFPGALATAGAQSAASIALRGGNAVFLSSLTQIQAPSLLSNLGKVGNYLTYTLQNPTYIASAPDDYVYVLTSQTESGSLAYFATTTNTFLYTMRLIPPGYYNLSNYSPASVTASSPGSWNSVWDDYWLSTTEQQQPDLYITSILDLSGCVQFLWKQTCASGSGAVNMNPVAVASDYASDIFMLGTYPSFSWSSSTGSSGLYLAEIPNNPQASTIISPDLSGQLPSGFSLSGPEFASAPSGQYVYVASASDNNGNVYLFQTPTGGNSGGSGFGYASSIPLSYSNSTYNMIITKYLANGGPFGNAQVASAYAGAATVNDVAGNHHPVALADVQGVLYVLDNWTFTVNNKQSAILMLRAFKNGTEEIPIDGSSHSSMLPVSSTQITTSQGTGASPSGGWSPYGWPLSATITTSSGLITYCAANCTYTPSTLSSAYPPIGPQIAPDGYVNGFGFSMDFNGTAYLIANSHYMYCDGTQSNGQCQSYYGSLLNHMYTELVAFKMTLANYTQTSLGAYSPYACYIDTSYSDSPCTYVNNPLLTNMQPPVEGVPSSFAYDTSEGSPEQYLSIQNVLSSAVPSGIASSCSGNSCQTQANQQESSGSISTGNGNIAPQSSYSNLQGTSTVSQPSALSPIYINSVITGSLIVPYCASYNLRQTWKAKKPYIIEGGPGGPECYNTLIGTGTNLYQTPCPLPPNPAPLMPAGATFPSAVDSSTTLSSTVSTCASATAPLQSNYLNDTVEGGGTYLQSMPNQQYYVANLSDASSIGLPYINYNIFTSRIFGEAYVNITINPTDYGFYTTSSAPTETVPATCTPSGFYSSQAGKQTSIYICPTDFSPSSCIGPVTTYVFSVAYFESNPASFGEEPETNYYCSVPLGPGSSPWVINAVQAYTYSLVNNEYTAFGKTYSAYYYQSAVPLNPPTGSEGISNCGAACTGYYYNPLNSFAGTSMLTYSSNTQINFVTTLSAYEQTSQLDSIILDQTANPSILGYNRLIYTFVDAFNNTIWAPLDTDLAHTTQITLAPLVSIDPTNANESYVDVAGTATYTTLSGGSDPLYPANVYIYYNTNLNYYDTANTINTGLSSDHTIGYYWDSLLCAFNPGGGPACQLANPLYAIVQTQPTGYDESGAVSFNPEYNSLSNPEQCYPEPASLLNTANIVYNCNIYHSYGLPAVYKNPGTGFYQYCLPYLSNGNGILTSQLGLVQMVQTDSNGNFDYKLNTCGNGNAQVIAAYYGYPPPQPLSVTQTLLPQSGGQSEFVTSPVTSTSYEFTYTYAPASTAMTITIGSFALGFGNLGMLSVLALAIAIVVIVWRARSS